MVEYTGIAEVVFTDTWNTDTMSSRKVTVVVQAKNAELAYIRACEFLEVLVQGKSWNIAWTSVKEVRSRNDF